MFPKSFQEVITVASKTEYSVQLVIGLCFHSSTALTLTTKSCSWPCFRASPVWSARDEFSVSDCDKYIERKPALMGTHCMFTLMGKSGRFFFRGVIDGEERDTECECDYFARISLEIEVCKGMCDMHSECTHTSILRRQSKLSSCSCPPGN